MWKKQVGTATKKDIAGSQEKVVKKKKRKNCKNLLTSMTSHIPDKKGQIVDENENEEEAEDGELDQIEEV